MQGDLLEMQTKKWVHKENGEKKTKRVKEKSQD